MNIKRTNKLKTNSSGFGHIEMLLLVVAVVVIGGVGFFVYNNSNKKTASKATAHAGSYTKLGSTDGITTSACTTYSSARGGVFTVKVLFTKAATTPAQQYVVYDQNGKTYAISQLTQSTAYYAGTAASVTIKMFLVNRDYINIYSENQYQFSIVLGNSRKPYIISINQITDC